MNDPVFFSSDEFDDQVEGAGWFVWDKTGTYTHGPFATQQEAKQFLIQLHDEV